MGYSNQSSLPGTQIVTFGSSLGVFNWSIDDGQSTQVNPSSENKFDTYHPGYPLPQLFNSSLLDDGTHTLTIENLTGNMTVGPYALVRPGPQTSVKQQYIHVDHTDSTIAYEGSWVVTQGSGVPSPHIGAKEGDSILFGFCGE